MVTKAKNLDIKPVVGHKYGVAYCHIPSGKKVFISQSYQGGTYAVHCNYSGVFAFSAKHDDLKMWDYEDERDKHVVRVQNMPDITFNSFTKAVLFSIQHNAQMLTPINNP